jgi:hypothetical protein
MGQSCYYDGKQFSDGSEVCQSGVVKKCIDGTWADTAYDCIEGGGRKLREQIVECLACADMPKLALASKKIEPSERTSTGGVWICDPSIINILTWDGKNLPGNVVFFTAKEINWQPSAEAAYYNTPCPREDSGGHFSQFKLHALIIGRGTRAIGCRGEFAIEGTNVTSWVAVNDTDYSDNKGKIVMKVFWR